MENGKDTQPGSPGQPREVEELRHRLLHYQTALVELGTQGARALGPFIQQVLRADAEIIDVERVGYWTFEDEAQTLRCTSLYVASGHDGQDRPGDESLGDGGVRLQRAETPAYFDATRTSRIIAAHDVATDPRTRGFYETYCAPRGISSLLDVPVWQDGKLAGVLCHEHVGPKRRWRPVEQAFAVSMGQFVSLGLERADRLRAERALEDNQQGMALLSATAPNVSLLMLDKEGRIVTGRHSVSRWLKTLAGSPHTVLYPPQDIARGRPKAVLEQAMRRGHHSEQGWLLRPDGTRFWAHVSVRALREKDGTVRGYAIVTRDLTSQRLARQNERLLRTTARDARQQRLLAQTSAALSGSFDAQRLLERSAKVLCGDFADAVALQVEPSADGGSPRRAVHARTSRYEEALIGVAEALTDPADWGPTMRKLVARGSPVYVRELDEEALPRISRSGPVQDALRALIPASLIAAPLRVRRRSLGVLVVVRHRPEPPFHPRDVGTVRELSNRIAYAVENARLYEVAHESIRQRDEFLSIAAHELRTPLTTLQLQLQLLERDLGGPVAGRLAERHLATAQRQASRLSGLVHELLDLTRISAGRLELHRERADLGSVTAELLESVREDAARAGSALEADLEPGVIGDWDVGRVEQVLTNLLSNAIKYGRGQPVKITVRGTKTDAFVSVADQGLGIPAADVARIFGRFERAVSPRHFGGLGLGLFIARRIVDAHGGEIRVSSKPGQGAVFTVRLPKSPRAPAETGAEATDAHVVH